MEPDTTWRKSPALEQLERRAERAIAEYREPMALTDAIGARSTSRRKTRPHLAAERAYVEGLCEAIRYFTDDLTPAAVWARLEARDG